ncbi:hypothetical protein [Bacillus horti]|uniref:Uncharacterized protein n=1 Tax=Caldalkalibacillus horti TaxID=77523 RepID=A0ABT9VY77_9BACI|nr:hypothetical protein [Bacillus horti]MDQ0165953.1 hypothetical protein [Bacillus horti]
MKKYRFELLETDISLFIEKDHVILAGSLEDAIQKFVRKHDLEAPAYWDEPSFDTFIELTFKSAQGSVKYKITW